MILGIITALFFGVTVLFVRPVIYRYAVHSALTKNQPRNAFFAELGLCILACLAIYTFNRITYGFPLNSLVSMLVGGIIAGFFIGLDAALNQERVTILHAIEINYSAPFPKRLFSMTRKFTFITVTLTVFVSLVMILVFTRDILWLTQVAEDETSIHLAQLSVAYEIIFIMAVIMIMTINLIFAYSRNMKLLFNNETEVLEQVSDGNLSQKVPVATRDEFGVIASHTNTMIDGLRHRFELLSAVKLAEEVQQNLLPANNPDVDGFDISGTSIYCDRTGGDYYDYFYLPGSKLGIAVADVCGHGVGSAILMTSVRAFLHMAVSAYRSPAQLLNAINVYITRDCSGSGQFTSMFFLELDYSEKSLRWVRAGHDPALFFSSSDKSFSLLDGKGLVLGVDKEHQYQNTSGANINTGDIILIGTDGIWESTDSSGKMYGHQRLRDIIRKSSTESSQTIKDNIINDIAAFRKNIPQEDDITLVVIKIT